MIEKLKELVKVYGDCAVISERKEISVVRIKTEDDSCKVREIRVY